MDLIDEAKLQAVGEDLIKKLQGVGEDLIQRFQGVISNEITDLINKIDGLEVTITIKKPVKKDSLTAQ